jgi:hypothetical protein
MSNNANEFDSAWKQDLQKIRAASPETTLIFGALCIPLILADTHG